MIDALTRNQQRETYGIKTNLIVQLVVFCCALCLCLFMHHLVHVASHISNVKFTTFLCERDIERLIEKYILQQTEIQQEEKMPKTIHQCYMSKSKRSITVRFLSKFNTVVLFSLELWRSQPHVNFNLNNNCFVKLISFSWNFQQESKPGTITPWIVNYP